MQPVKLLRLQVLQEESVASDVLDVWPQSTADQDGAYDGLRETQPEPVTKDRPPAGIGTVLRALSLTLTCQELSHFTSLKFLPRLLLVQKHTLRILTAPLSTVKCDSGLESAPLGFGMGTFQDKVSPDITSYMVKAGPAPSYLHRSSRRQKRHVNQHYCCASTAGKQRNVANANVA